MLEPREVHTAAKMDVGSSAVTAKDASSAVAPALDGLRLPKPAVVVPPTTVQAAKPATTTVQAMRPNFDLAEKDLQKVGHETDYSWITGKLVRGERPTAAG